jgi:hypothetical protein
MTSIQVPQFLTDAISTIPDDEKKAGSMMVGEMLRNACAQVQDVPCYEFDQLKSLAGVVEHFSKFTNVQQQFQSDENARRKYKILLGAARESVFFDAISRHERAVINKTYRAVAKMSVFEKFVDFCKEVWRDWTRAHDLNMFDDIAIARFNIDRLLMVDRIKEGSISYLKTCIQLLDRDVKNAGKIPRKEGSEERLKAHKFSATTNKYIDKYTARALERIQELEQEKKGSKPKAE